MDDNEKQVSSYQLDQEILDARGINMTVEEVAGLSTCKYSERVQSMHLTDNELAFLKGLRRRIKNRLASQNSRRRSMEHLRRLTRELRAVRACRDDALAERRALLQRRDLVRNRCVQLRAHLCQALKDRSDSTEVPSIDLLRLQKESLPTSKENSNKITVCETKTPLLADCFKEQKIERDKTVFECRLDKLVQQSVNHIFKEEKQTKKITAKTVFITNDKLMTDVKLTDVKMSPDRGDGVGAENREGKEVEGVLNLSVKRRSHGRKQTAPRRIAYACFDGNDGVLDLKIKKEPQ